MKKVSPDCSACPYKLGLIKTLLDPCERCKEMYKKYGAVQCDKTVCEFLRKYQKQKSSCKVARQ